MGYRSNGAGRSTVWGTGRMEHGGLQCGVLVEWKGGLQCGALVEWNREFYSVGYRSNGKGRSTVWGTGRIAGEILG